MTFTAQDVENAIANIPQDEIEEKTGYFSIWQYFFEEGHNFSYELEDIGTLTVDDTGGIFHDGGDIFTILEVNGRLFMKASTYSSWDSSYWDSSLVEVESFEKTVIDYRPA